MTPFHLFNVKDSKLARVSSQNFRSASDSTCCHHIISLFFITWSHIWGVRPMHKYVSILLLFASDFALNFNHLKQAILRSEFVSWTFLSTIKRLYLSIRLTTLSQRFPHIHKLWLNVVDRLQTKENREWFSFS